MLQGLKRNTSCKYEYIVGLNLNDTEVQRHDMRIPQGK